MCLVAVAIDQSRRFPLVVAANRDEFFDRATARLAWWTPADGGPAILGGRDLEGGGTWMGLTAKGRLALVTNVRQGTRPRDADAPSRGRVVVDWLSARDSSDRFWMRTALSGYDRFNLIAADFAQGECFWASNDGTHPLRLERGLYGLSNASLDTPWPKVRALKARVEAALAAESVDELANQLFAALADRSAAADEELPATGIPIERERLLSPAFIRTPDLRYGTRASTLLLTERVGRRFVTHVLERSFGANGGMALLRRASLRDWPPRWGQVEPAAAQQGAVSEAEMTDLGLPLKRTRVRGLLKPDPARRRREPAAAS
jgi:uncharacterized protein with NRDE domain